jgi:ABC-type antimicrobial peptide transport system permease subunit
MSLLLTHIRLARTSIKENRTRSFLTCLGIAVGVASIILILSLTGSITRLVSEETKTLGEELIIVRPSSHKDMVTNILEELTATNAYQKSSLALEDVATIKEIENIEAAAPVAITTATVMSDKNTVESATVLGTNEDFIKIQPMTFRYGSFVTSKFNNNTAVVGHTMSLVLFNTTNPVGKTLTIFGERFVVVGVISKMEDAININNVDFDNAVILNADSLAKAAGGVQVQQIDVKATNIDCLEQASADIEKALVEKKSGENNFTVVYGDKIKHPASALFTIVSGMLTMVAGISLIVGGIGVMNIMLVSVAERTHEIGIRKAVGASGRNILVQFLFESLILSVMGGFLGLALGYVLAFFVSIITPFAPYISWQILAMTFGVSVGVGVLFGIYPAIKAATKNPIESLKHYR